MTRQVRGVYLRRGRAGSLQREIRKRRGQGVGKSGPVRRNVGSSENGNTRKGGAGSWEDEAT